jgi:hypothetical protein
MTSYRIAAVAAVSSANAALSALVYMPPPAHQPRRRRAQVTGKAWSRPNDIQNEERG